MLHRRTLLSAVIASALPLPWLSLAAAETDQRLVVIVLRGAMDGLYAVIPYGESSYAPARRQLADRVHEDGAPLRLDGLFALHPSLIRMERFFQQKQAIFAHAVATPYRERSHFDGQDILETGTRRAHAASSGWLARFLTLLPRGEAVALSAAIPLLLRGNMNAAAVLPSAGSDPGDAMLASLDELYRDDPLLASLWDKALATRELVRSSGSRGKSFPELAALAAYLLASPGGPRIAVLESTGWDTHTNQPSRLARKLRQLDTAVAALEQGLQDKWRQTLTVVVTEFGRTIEPNGTGGTDHGTGSVAMLFGGSLNGGRIIVDWPGLARTARLDGRDLKPTIDVRALLAGAVAEHFALDSDRVAQVVFPGLESRSVLSNLRCG